MLWRRYCRVDPLRTVTASFWLQVKQCECNFFYSLASEPWKCQAAKKPICRETSLMPRWISHLTLVSLIWFDPRSVNNLLCVDSCGKKISFSVPRKLLWNYALRSCNFFSSAWSMSCKSNLEKDTSVALNLQKGRWGMKTWRDRTRNSAHGHIRQLVNRLTTAVDEKKRAISCQRKERVLSHGHFWSTHWRFLCLCFSCLAGGMNDFCWVDQDVDVTFCVDEKKRR